MVRKILSVVIPRFPDGTPLGTLSLKVKQNSFPVKKEEILQSDLIPKICDVNTRSISEYQNIQEEGL